MSKYIVCIDEFELTEEEYQLFEDNELSLYEILDDRFARDKLNIYIKEKWIIRKSEVQRKYWTII